MTTPQYWAGLFDGEGMVSLCYCNVRDWRIDTTKKVQCFKFVIGISNTFAPVIDELQRQFDGDITANNRRPDRHKTVWAWKICGRARQHRFLSTIAPYAIIKKEHVELGLEYVSTMVEPGQRLDQGGWNKRIKIYERLRELNRAGFARQPIKPRLVVSQRPNPRDLYSPEDLGEQMERVRSFKS